MDDLARQALRNSYRAVTAAAKTGTITARELADQLRQPLPPVGSREDDATILSTYMRVVVGAGVRNRLVSYVEASKLSGKSVDSIRMARSRGVILGTTEYRDGGRARTVGVWLYSLAGWLRWGVAQTRKASEQLDAMRRINDANA